MELLGATGQPREGSSKTRKLKKAQRSPRRPLRNTEQPNNLPDEVYVITLFPKVKTKGVTGDSIPLRRRRRRRRRPPPRP
eukprot:8855636-Pyramimonas_sp.AAC.1